MQLTSTTAADRAVEAFCELTRALHAPGSVDWLTTDLTLVQLKALLFLSARGRSAGRALARALGVGPSAVSQLVDRLVAQGYVARSEAPDDRRVTWLSVTARGEGLLDRLLLARRERLAAALEAIPPSEHAEIAAALAKLARAARALDAMEGPTC